MCVYISFTSVTISVMYLSAFEYQHSLTLPIKTANQLKVNISYKIHNFTGEYVYYMYHSK